jgi:VanZ family protein
MSKRYDKKRVFYIVITFLVALLIFLFSNIPSSMEEKVIFNLAIIYHFGVFFMFTFFLFLALKSGKIKTKMILTVLLISLAYAFSDELHQLFVSGRFCSFKDIIVDFAGSICSMILIKIFEKFKRI